MKGATRPPLRLGSGIDGRAAGVGGRGREHETVEPGMRIAQMVISRVERAVIEECESLDETLRGAGGFGSTGH